ncbi:MAG: TlpA family protein disulfide reductase [Desulfobacca sp.]|uniref:TlpA family protein disulfide reductase n=1 Tax=Desulfobacca sp. TaxID=2067990 RepID=UPI00404ADD28
MQAKRRGVSLRLALWLLLTFLLWGAAATAMAVEKGDLAPDFSLPDLGGNTTTLSQLRGKVVIVNFFTVWCQPCRHEMPDLNAIFNEKREHGVVVLGICLNADPKQLQVLVKQLKLDYPVLLGTEKVSKDYGDIVAVPTTFILNKEGKIAEKITGPRKKEEFLKMMAPLL